MPGAPRIAPQDPSLSPTFGLSTGQTEPAIPPSIRRNLFSAHLSRRPVAATNTNIFAPSSPTAQNGNARHDVFSSGPTLHPTKRMMDLQDIYDPNISPSSHAVSPSTSVNLFPRESIIAIDPVTGRPLLPNLPTLPPRLRLSDEDDDEDGSDEEMQQQEYLEYGRNSFAHSPSHTRNYGPPSDFDFDPDIDLDSSDLNFLGMSRGQNVLHNFVDADDNEENRRGRERIEQLLADMMNKQRARARTLTTSDSAGNSMSATAQNGTRGTRGGRSRDRRVDSATARPDSQRPAAEPGLGGVGSTMDPGEKDELMGLIMTSLRRKLQQAEDEGWMYGGAEGLGGLGLGTEHVGDGIYD